MISLEQVQLLETRVSRAIEYVEKVTAENSALAAEKAGLQKKLEANQKRIDELEVLVVRFKEEQGRIEDGIVAALDRLSQFEEAFENSLKDTGTVKKNPAKAREKAPEKTSGNSSKEIYFNITEKEAAKENEQTDDASNDTSQDALSSEGELDIF